MSIDKETNKLQTFKLKYNQLLKSVYWQDEIDPIEQGAV